jgi:hypothetical protein
LIGNGSVVKSSPYVIWERMDAWKRSYHVSWVS